MKGTEQEDSLSKPISVKSAFQQILKRKRENDQFMSSAAHKIRPITVNTASPVVATAASASRSLKPVPEVPSRSTSASSNNSNSVKPNSIASGLTNSSLLTGKLEPIQLTGMNLPATQALPNVKFQIRGTWTPIEDEAVVAAVNKYGCRNWKQVEQEVPGRTAKQCRDRYRLKLDPSINHGEWTASEDAMLLQLHATLKNQWTKIAAKIPGRTENAVKSRCATLQKQLKRNWQPEEDRLLRECMRQNMTFVEIAKTKMEYRTEHMVKKRWNQLLLADVAESFRKSLPPDSQVPQPAEPSASSFVAIKKQATVAAHRLTNKEVDSVGGHKAEAEQQGTVEHGMARYSSQGSDSTNLSQGSNHVKSTSSITYMSKGKEAQPHRQQVPVEINGISDPRYVNGTQRPNREGQYLSPQNGEYSSSNAQSTREMSLSDVQSTQHYFSNAPDKRQYVVTTSTTGVGVPNDIQQCAAKFMNGQQANLTSPRSSETTTQQTGKVPNGAPHDSGNRSGAQMYLQVATKTPTECALPPKSSLNSMDGNHARLQVQTTPFQAQYIPATQYGVTTPTNINLQYHRGNPIIGGDARWPPAFVNQAPPGPPTFAGALQYPDRASQGPLSPVLGSALSPTATGNGVCNGSRLRSWSSQVMVDGFSAQKEQSLPRSPRLDVSRFPRGHRLLRRVSSSSSMGFDFKPADSAAVATSTGNRQISSSFDLSKLFPPSAPSGVALANGDLTSPSQGWQSNVTTNVTMQNIGSLLQANQMGNKTLSSNLAPAEGPKSLKSNFSQHGIQAVPENLRFLIKPKSTRKPGHNSRLRKQSSSMNILVDLIEGGIRSTNQQ